MIFRKKKIRNNDTGLAYLSSKLNEDHLKPTLTDEQLSHGRQSVLNYIRASKGEIPELSPDEAAMVSRLKNIAQNLQLSPYHRISMRERVLSYCKKKRGFKFNYFILKPKFLLAGLLLMVLSFVSVIAFPEETFIIKASKWTFIEEVQGQAFILRDGKSLQAKQGFSLQEGDILVTKDGSLIAVRFFDDSVARLGQNTAVEIKKLYAKPKDSATTAIEVALQQGYVWTKVINLEEESRFVVNTDNAVATVKDKAAFEVSKSTQGTTLKVFDNVVDFKTKATGLEHIQPVVKGFTAEVSSPISYNSTDSSSDHTFTVSVNDEHSDNSWVALNRELDKEHEEKIKKENQDFIDQTVEPSPSALSFLQDIQKNTKSLLPQSDFEKVKSDLSDAHNSFIKAQKLLLDSNSKNEKRTEALKYLYQYKSTIRQVMAQMPDFKLKDQKQAEIIENFINEFISLQKKNLALILPGEKLFTAKQVMNEVSSYLIQDDLDKVEHLLSETKDTLLEVAGLIEKRQFAQAESHFKLYSKKLDQLVIEVNESAFPNLNAQLVDLLKQQLQQIKLLTTIGQDLGKTQNNDMQQIVKKVTLASISKLLTVTKALKAQLLPFQFLQELHGSIKNYFGDNSDIESFFTTLDQLMQSYPEYKLWKENEPDVSLKEDRAPTQTQEVNSSLDAADSADATDTATSPQDADPKQDVTPTQVSVPNEDSGKTS